MTFFFKNRNPKIHSRGGLFFFVHMTPKTHSMGGHFFQNLNPKTHSRGGIFFQIEEAIFSDVFVFFKIPL